MPLSDCQYQSGLDGELWPIPKSHEADQSGLHVVDLDCEAVEVAILAFPAADEEGPASAPRQPFMLSNRVPPGFLH